MTDVLFPDNTVLISFALINRMDLLRRLANGKGRWCASVASECRNSAKRFTYPSAPGSQNWRTRIQP